MDMENVDITQCGYFHLSSVLEEYINLSGEAVKLTDYRINKKEYLLALVDKVKAPCPQRQAVLAEIPVLMYFSPHRKREAVPYLENILEGTDCKESVNVIANLIFIYKNNRKEDKSATISELEEKLEDICKNDFEVARAMCERGFFCQSQFDEGIRSLPLQLLGIKLLEKGIEDGGSLGMSQNELTVWRYYLADLHRQVFDFQTPEQGGDVDLVHITPFFNKMAESFQHFFTTYASDACTFYKSRAMIDIMLTMIINNNVMEVLPFGTIQEKSEMLDYIWQEQIPAAKEAMAMSALDYHIPKAIAKYYTNTRDFEKTLKYADESLKLEGNINSGTLHLKLYAYSNLAKQYDGERNTQLAYEEGKKIEAIHMPQSSAFIMSRICYHLAVDKSSRMWYVPKEKVHYLDEAMYYAKMGIKTKNGQEHAALHNFMGDCLWMKDSFEESLHYFRQAVKFSAARIYPRNANYLLNKYRFTLFNRKLSDSFKQRIITLAADDLEFIWDKVQGNKDLKDVLIKFGNSLSGRDRYIRTILEEIKCRGTENSEQLLKGYCKLLHQDDNTTPWLRQYCQ